MCLVPRIAREFLGNVDNRPREFFELVMPPVDVMEDGTNLIIKIDLPGFEKSEINLRIVENILSISASREVKPKHATIYNMHRPVTINKKVTLPISTKDYESEKIVGKATYVDGVVTLTIPLKNRIIVT
jgi:HSP20 family protein